MGLLSGLFGTKTPKYKPTPSAYDQAGKDLAFQDFKAAYDLLYKQAGGEPILTRDRVDGIYLPARQVAASGVAASGRRTGEAMRAGGVHPDISGARMPGFTVGGPEPALQPGPGGAVARPPDSGRLAAALSGGTARGGQMLSTSIARAIQSGDYDDLLNTPGKAIEALTEILQRDRNLQVQQDQAKYAAKVAKAKKGSFLGSVLKGAIGGAMGGMG